MREIREICWENPETRETRRLEMSSFRLLFRGYCQSKFRWYNLSKVDQIK